MPTTRPTTARHRAETGRRRDRPARGPLDALRAVAVGVPVGLVACGALVWQGSYAAFTSTTDNPTSSWTTGTVALSDNDANVAMFDATGLSPGSPAETKCLRVTSTGSLTSNVKMHAAVLEGTTLAQQINVKVEVGLAGASTFPSCGAFNPVPSGAAVFDGTLASFASTHGSFATGFGSWSATTGSSRQYRITYSMNPAATSAVQGTTTKVTFTWETQS